MKKTLITALSVGTFLSPNLNASTLYLESTTPYSFNSKEYTEFRKNYESKLSKLCEDYKYNKNISLEQFAIKTSFVSSSKEFPFYFNMSIHNIEFFNSENSPQQFYARCK